MKLFDFSFASKKEKAAEPEIKVEDLNYEPSAENMSGADLGELMEKYGLEEWELIDLAKKCELYLKQAKGPMPREDYNEVRDLAVFYREYLAAKSEDGLPLSEEERGLASAEQLAAWKEAKDRIASLIFSLAELNENSQGQPQVDSNIVYSTNTKLSNDLLQKKEELLDLQYKLSDLENLLTKPKKVDNEKNKIDVWESVPEYSDEELRVLEEAVAYLRNKRAPKPKFATGEELAEEQIIESAREYAQYKMWPKAFFKSQNFKGRRQLVYTERFYDSKAKTNRTIRFIYDSNDLPAGMYHFEPKVEAFFVNSKDKNFAVAPIDTMVNADKPKKSANKEVASHKKAG